MAAEPGAWIATVSSRVLAVGAVVLGAAAATVLVFWLVARPGLDFLVILLVLALAAGFCAACARIRVTIDSAGVACESTFFGFTLARFGLDEIADARVEQVTLGSWFGWGYRVTLGASALVLRAGPGLVLELVSGKQFTVTLPEAAAALVALEAVADAGRP